MLYRTYVRTILTYGLSLAKDTKEMEGLDRKLLNLYFKRLCFLGRALPGKLIDRLCLKLRLPSLQMEVDHVARNWTGKIRRAAEPASNRKVRAHARDSLKSIQKLHPNTPLRS